MHGDTSSLGGPVFVAVLALFYGTGLMAIFVSIDVFRPRRAPLFADKPKSRLMWVVPQLLFLAMFIAARLPWTSLAVVSTAVVIATPFVLGLQIAYLLRVVYPKPALLAVGDLADITVVTDPEE